jgi:uncharacterized protein (TIGR02996 family)
MRTFQRGRDRFWNIRRQGTTVSVAYGKVGGKAQTRKTVSRPESAARRLYQRMIREKLEDGYVETTAAPGSLQAVGLALEAALVENPDDLSAHMAYADWLSEQPEAALQARGEFIRVQLRLEARRLSAEERKKLTRKEKQLRIAHEHEWLGPRLADYLIDGGGDQVHVAVTDAEEAPREYRRGWLDKLAVLYLDKGLGGALAESPAIRLLRELVVKDTSDEAEAVAPLAAAKTLLNVRKLTVEDYSSDAPVSDLIANLPRVEEIHLLAAGLDSGRLFGLRNLENLRVLHVAGAEQYPIRDIAANASLGRLETLTLIPPGLEGDEQPHLRLAATRALVRSKALPALRHLALHRSDMGDAGCREIADSGVLGRLETLDLTSGCVSDEGARILAGAKDFAHLKKLDLTDNRLTEEGEALLQRKGLELITAKQQVPDEGGHYEDAYLYDEEYFAWLSAWDADQDGDWE